MISLTRTAHGVASAARHGRSRADRRYQASTGVARSTRPPACQRPAILDQRVRAVPPLRRPPSYRPMHHDASGRQQATRRVLAAPDRPPDRCRSRSSISLYVFLARGSGRPGASALPPAGTPSTSAANHRARPPRRCDTAPSTTRVERLPRRHAEAGGGNRRAPASSSAASPCLRCR